MPGRRGAGRTLAAVVAHPDDDAYGVAGIVALHAADPRFRFVLVHATDGEAGSIAPGSGATRATLGAVRREEDRRAWAVLGRPPDRHEWFGYPDGGLADVPERELTDRVAAVLAEERPDVVLTFGPDGITGHPDHVAVGRATDAAFLRLAGDGGPGLRRLVHGAIRQSVIDRWNATRTAAGQPAWDPGTVFHPRGVPDADIGVAIDTTTVAPRIRAAMLEHRTQSADLDPPDLTEAQKLANVSRETEVLVWPQRAPGRVLTDVFEDLA
jgi:LmbE family N-acetylglucosaminyl deacetylase